MKIFLGGNVSRREFRSVERDVRVAAARFDAEICAVESLDVGSLKKTPSNWSDVDFFVLCRSFPGEFFPVDVERLRRAAPLAPIALVAGALCEGENRTGATFPGTRRCYVGGWRESIRREFFRFLTDSTGLFAASPSATNVDFLAAPRFKNRANPSFFSETPFSATSFSATSLSPTSFSPNAFVESKIAIFSDSDPAFGRFLRELFAERGADARIESLSRNETSADADSTAPAFAPDRIVVDSVDLAANRSLDALRTIRQKYPTPPLDLLAFSPRVEEVEFFEKTAQLGRVCVLAKPFDVDFLLTVPENRMLYLKERRFIDNNTK